jgi:hypothetical protein
MAVRKQSNNAPKQTVLFIGGLGRSGTTLIERILNELPGAFSVGETIHLWERGVQNNEVCGCGKTFQRCKHWSAVGKDAFAGWNIVDLTQVTNLRWNVDRFRRLPQLFNNLRTHKVSNDQQAYIDYLTAVIVSSAKVAGKPQVILESSKHVSTAVLLTLSNRLDVKILHVIRDPRGVSYSWTKEIARPEAGGTLMPRYKPTRTALRWITDNLAFDHLAKKAPTLRLRYEDFLDNPQQQIQAIADFVGLKTQESDLAFIKSPTTKATVMHSVAGNPLRFQDNISKLQVDLEWTKELNRRHKVMVTTMSLPLLLKYKYPLRSPR